MKRKYIEENNIIEEYLLNKLSDEDRKAFRVALLFDESLRKEVEDTRFLHQQIKQLKPQNTITQKKVNNNKWLIPLFILVALVASFFVYKNVLKKDVETKDIIENSSMNEEGLNQNNEPKQEKIEEEIFNEEEKPKETTPITPVETGEKPEINQPIASADITPHPYLDQFTRSAFRNNKALIEVSKPKQGQTIKLDNGKIKFEVGGTFLTKKALLNKRYVIRLFTNKKIDFDTFKPIISVYPVLKKSTNGYEFSSQNIVPFTKGLYYFIIEDTELEDMVYVGKFFVK